MKRPDAQQHSVLFVSLGCDKNLVDSERMLGDLASRGYTFTDDEETADIAVVNTCCFINDAKKESIDQILSLAQRRTDGQLQALIVTDCLAQRYREEILTEIPEVDAVIGTTAKGQLAEALQGVLEHSDQPEKLRLRDLSVLEESGERLLSTGGHYAYLKIAEGCDKCCTYCVIPGVRGRYRSVPQEDLVREARKLAEQGVRELILVAQETTLYGVDLYGRKRLPDLLRQLCAIDGIE
jgi:ribosomal protein S12 methylthiotransferase